MKLLEIERLRAFAVIMVLVGHLPISVFNYLLHGYTGVTLFFVISGFVVARTFLKEVPVLSDQSVFDRFEIAKDSLNKFYLRRVFRILPSAISWIIIYFLTAKVINAFGGQYGDSLRWAKEIKWALSGFFNYYMASSHMPSLFGQYWSLFVEMHFYFILPLLLILIPSQKIRLGLFFSIIALVVFVFRPLAPSFTEAAMWTHNQLDGLLSGVILYLITNKSTQFKKSVIQIPQWIKSLVFLSLIGLLWVLPFFTDGTILDKHMHVAFVMISTLIVFLALQNTGWVSLSFEPLDRFLVYLGSRSYALYVSHIIFFSGIFVNFYPKISALLPESLKTSIGWYMIQLIVLFGTVLLFSDLSFRWIEVPFINLGKTVCNRFFPNNKKDFSTQAIRA